jgi:hypothetical protein
MRIFVNGECGAVPPTSVIVKPLLSPRKAGDLDQFNGQPRDGDTCQHFGVDGVRHGSKALAGSFGRLTK